MKLASIWFQHLPEKDQDDFKKKLFNSSGDPVLMRLMAIIQERRNSLEASERSTKVYELSNWAYLQAHNNGMQQALKLIEDLLSFVKD